MALAWTTAGPAEAQADAPRPQPVAGQELRLASLAYRMAVRNADRCAVPEQLTGMLLHDRAAYDARDRDLIGARYDLGDGFGVRDVVAGSAADRAGIRRGDEIVALNGSATNAFERALFARKGSYTRSEAFEAMLDRALRQGPVMLVLRRHAGLLTVRLAGEPGCGGRPVMIPAGHFNAWSDGKYVAVTSRLMTEVADDAELAFVVAHEMSHNILHHQEQLQGRSGLLAEFGFGSGRVKDTEIAADTLAVGLLANAGYDLEAPARFLALAARKRPFDLAITHPGLKRRIGIVTAEIARLQVHPSHAQAIAASNAGHDGTPAPARTTDIPSLYAQPVSYVPPAP